MASNPKRRAPPAIFDNLEHLVESEASDSMLDAGWDVGNADIAVDYPIVCRFLVSYDGSTATFTAYRPSSSGYASGAGAYSTDRF